MDLSKEGEYIENFSVEDSSGNKTTKEIKIIVREKNKNTYIVISGNYGNTPYGTYSVRNKATNVTLKDHLMIHMNLLYIIG